jgi:hypothetical protein
LELTKVQTILLLENQSYHAIAIFDFCDTLEVKDGVAAGAKGQGLQYALSQWGEWQKQSNVDREITTKKHLIPAARLLIPSLSLW